MKKDIKVTILNIVIIALAVVLVITVFGTISEACSAFNDYSYDEDSFIYCMEDENYADLVRFYYDNCGSDGKEDKKLQEYYDLAKYFEAAFHHKIYAESGDGVRAGKYKAIMDETKARMGELAFVTERMNGKLGGE